MSNINNGIMGWTKDDKVLAMARFGPSVQRDYKVVAGRTASAAAPAAAASGAPNSLPVTGDPGQVGLVALGVLALLSGGLLRRRA